jgi:hypothetical protein
VTFEVGDQRVFGFVFEHEGRTWLALHPIANTSVAGMSGRLVPTSADPARAKPEALALSVQSSIPLGDPPLLNLVDITERQAELTDRGVHPPPLIDSTGAWRQDIPGNLLLIMWLDMPGGNGVMHRLTRVESLQCDDSTQTCRMAVAPALPQAAVAAPALDHAGFLAGAVLEPVTQDGASAVVIGPDSIAAAIRSQPFAWPNNSGLNALVAELRGSGFSRLAMYRVRHLDTGEFNGTYDAPTTSSDEAMLSFLSADEAQALRFTMRLGSSCQLQYAPIPENGKTSEDVFSHPPEGASMKVNRPHRADGAEIHVTSNSGDPSSRLLEIHAVRETALTSHLPRIESLLGLGRQAATPRNPYPSGPASTSRKSESPTDDPSDPCADLPESVYGPPQANGPIIRIPLHGTVGCLREQFFNAADFKRALRRAATLKPSAIILDIESPGGRVDTMDEIIGEVILAQASGERVVAEVRDAGSAAALITLACKEILAHPAARVGAAVAITTQEDGSTISLRKLAERERDQELEAKYESFAKALHDEAARKTGRSPLLAEAMRKSEIELWWSPSLGFRAKSTGAAGEQLVDNDKDILTLTCSQIKDFGIGKQCLTSDEVPNLLGLAGREVQLRKQEIECTLQRILQLQEAGADPAEIEPLVSQP